MPSSKLIVKRNACNVCDGRYLLTDIKDNAAAAVFFDPQYRGVLDKLKYGNEGKSRGKKRAALQQMTNEVIAEFMEGIDRVLRPSGHLFLWVDKFHAFNPNREDREAWFEKTTLELVDAITWVKPKIGMGYRTRRKSEFLLIYQQHPKRAKDVWTNHTIADVWEEAAPANPHPHTKPLRLLKALIEATTQVDDLIVDPAAGSYMTMTAARQTVRQFFGCDLQLPKED